VNTIMINITVWISTRIHQIFKCYGSYANFIIIVKSSKKSFDNSTKFDFWQKSNVVEFSTIKFSKTVFLISFHCFFEELNLWIENFSIIWVLLSLLIFVRVESSKKWHKNLFFKQERKIYFFSLFSNSHCLPSFF